VEKKSAVEDLAVEIFVLAGASAAKRDLPAKLQLPRWLNAYRLLLIANFT